MPLHKRNATLDDILESWRDPLSSDFAAYKHHCYRVLNFCLALCGEHDGTIQKVSIATACHDLGIWANNTFDYLAPSKEIACAYLARISQIAWRAEIETMIDQHHKIRAYTAYPEWLVEPFRKADWIDISRGLLKFDLPSAFIAEVLAHFPNAGFHRRLADLALQRLKTHPFSPLPMMKW